MFKHFQQRILAGIIVILPWLVVLFITAKLIEFAAWFSVPILRAILGPEVVEAGVGSVTRVFFGMIGLAVVIVATYLLGAITQNRLLKWAVTLPEAVVRRLPFAGALFGAVRQTVQAFDLSAQGDRFRRVVYIEFPRPGMLSLGFVTQEVVRNGQPWAFVFIPTTPNPTNGFLVLAPKADLQDTGARPEDAFKCVLSGGILVPASMKNLDAPPEATLDVPSAKS
jgi:uncharacterized membrane protein